MKANAAQLGAAIERAATGSTDIRLFVLHGPDEGGASDYAQRLQRAMGQVERVDLDGAALKTQPGRLADEAASLSLFGDRRYVRVTNMGEESLEAIQLLLDAPTAGSPVIAFAPAARATGKLIKLAAAASGAMVLACYPPEGRNAAQLAAGIAREHGVRLIGESAAAMFDAAAGDRAVLTREIEKLALYLDAATDRPREADAATLAEIGANIDEVQMSSAIDAVIDGRPDALGVEIAALTTANMAVPMLRQLGKRLIALADMRADVDRGDSPDSVVERHRVFWKEKAGTIRALRRWDSRHIGMALARVRRAERGLISGGGTSASVLAEHDLFNLSRSASRL